MFYRALQGDNMDTGHMFIKANSRTIHPTTMDGNKPTI